MILKNKKAQLDEINPMAIGMGLIGGLVGVVIVSRVNVGIIWKILTFVACSVACYIVGAKMLGD